MQTKSNIQLIREKLEKLDEFKKSIESLMDRYIVEDSYFGFNNEYTNGYFVFEHEYDNINDAIINMELNSDQVIRVIENKRFQIGKRVTKLSEADGSKVIDITSGKIVKND